jgi:C-terminal processing protease CtpA/Prc
MKTDLTATLYRISCISGAFVVLLATATAQQPPAQPAAPKRADVVQPVREQARETAQAARETVQDSRQATRETVRDTRDASQDNRQGARETARENRQSNQDIRAGGREEAQTNRQGVRDVREQTREAAADIRQDAREARRDLREARREFRAERLRSGDLGLWIRNAANRLLVSDVAGRGAIAQAGLKEGDQIISVNGQHVATEREFIDRLFANQDYAQPVPVVISRNGQQQTIQITPKTFVDEYMVADANSLHEYGIIIDDSVPDHLRVKAVIPRSPAYYAGVRSGDDITSFRGQRVNAIADLVRGIVNAAGSSAPLEVNRNNQSRELEIEIPAQSSQGESRTALRPNFQGQGTAAPNQPLQPPRPQTAPQNPQPRRP